MPPKKNAAVATAKETQLSTDAAGSKKRGRVPGAKIKKKCKENYSIYI